ncbi:MAG: hypothetical protein OXH36_00500 [Bdellovibrionales bacterium]|nr:hypothetical protein [Bdellovibrionales bacterium]
MKEKENFLDKNTLIAVALVFMTWLLWDSYMRKKYPVEKRPITQEEKRVDKQEQPKKKEDLLEKPACSS